MLPLLSQAYQVLGEHHLAMMNFSWALDLDPKGTNNHIKEAVERQQGSDDQGGFTRRNGEFDGSKIDINHYRIEFLRLGNLILSSAFIKKKKKKRF